MRSTVSRRWTLLVSIAISIILLDQWTKFLAVKHLTSGIEQAHRRIAGEDAAPPSLATQIGYFYGEVENPCRQPGSRCPVIRLVDQLWHWDYAENPGAAWSFLADAGDAVRVPFFLSVSILAILMIFWFYYRLEPGQYLMMVALALVLGGAMGNLIDRVRLNYVIDFIVWYVGSYRWPTFNLADSAISTGVAVLVIDSLLDLFRPKKQITEEA